ncbi:MAG: hypothetical protein NVV83_08290 [Afipia sp.]|nr:hypothetical protein [Afipia sp.]
MGEEADKNLITVTLPTTYPGVAGHHDGANVAIEAMSPSRRYGADTNLRSWRRLLKSIDPAHENGWSFSGLELQPGAQAVLPASSIVVACDLSWAKAKWYAGQYIKPLEVEAALYEATGEGLVQLTRSVRRVWARDLLGWLITNRAGDSYHQGSCSC